MGLALALALSLLGVRTDPARPSPRGCSLPTTEGAADARPTVFSHANTRYWVSGQLNVVTQAHRTFSAPYSGPHSLSALGEARTSRVLTLYTGLRLTRNVSLLFDLEMTGGRGIADAFGLAGYTNLDVVRNPTLGGTPYVARLMLHYVVPLSDRTVENERGPFTLAARLPARRLELRAGKVGLVDFFDVNAVGSDSHLQSLNWAIDNNAAYDYAADTRGYTVAAIAEYHDGPLAIRFAEALMPTVANGLDLDYHLARSHSENVEVELPVRVAGREAIVRTLAYANHANMGSYRDAIARYEAGVTPQPDVTAHARQTRLKYGGGVNVELPVAAGVRAYARAGWNEGANESFVYTEANSAVSGGVGTSGERWRRAHDRAGVAVASEGISFDHRDYLVHGGLGFLLGDGALRYGRERVIEAYYTARVWNGVFVAVDLQRITNPGYNRDRGPVTVGGVRLHVDF